MFKDAEWSQVYLYDRPVEIEELRLQDTEVESVCWMDYHTCLRHIQEKSLPNCIYEEEFLMIGSYLGFDFHLGK